MQFVAFFLVFFIIFDDALIATVRDNIRRTRLLLRSSPLRFWITLMGKSCATQLQFDFWVHPLFRLCRLLLSSGSSAPATWYVCSLRTSWNLFTFQRHGTLHVSFLSHRCLFKCASIKLPTASTATTAAPHSPSTSFSLLTTTARRCFYMSQNYIAKWFELIVWTHYCRVYSYYMMGAHISQCVTHVCVCVWVFWYIYFSICDPQ